MESYSVVVMHGLVCSQDVTLQCHGKETSESQSITISVVRQRLLMKSLLVIIVRGGGDFM